MRMPDRGSALALLGLGVFLSVALGVADDRLAYAQASAVPAEDPVARLARRVERGEVSLDRRPGTGYLRSLLERLDVSVDSQVLVFSKTSFQQAHISPRAPRAIFFNDAVAVGSVRDSDVLELVAIDPGRGLNFYTLTPMPSQAPVFERRGIECVFCHAPGNLGVPGLVVTSVIPNAEGSPFFSGKFFSTTDHRTPFEERWGGWYVSGTHGSQTHLGNAVAPDPDLPADLDRAGSQNVTTLTRWFDPAGFLAATSDLVALLTLEHQVGMTNFMTRVAWQYERAQRFTATDAVARGLDAAIEDMVTYMLFADEAPLREPVAGVSTFTRTFPARGPRDRLGRSLRDFDLRTRLFKYPLTYLIYSEAFDRLPSGLRRRLYERLHEVLTGKDQSRKFASLSAGDRRAVLEILLETKPNLPDAWRSSAGGH